MMLLGKYKFWKCLEMILVEEMRQFGKDKFENVLELF